MAEVAEQSGVPVGAIRLAREHIEPLRHAFEQHLGERIGFRGVDAIPMQEGSDDGCEKNMVMVHLPPIAAGCAGNSVMADFLSSIDAAFLPGVRRMPNSNKKQHQRRDLEPATEEVVAAEQCLKFAEIFAGIGGFRLGLEALGCKCVFASEISSSAASIYAQNFGDEELAGDIIGLYSHEIPDFDILTGGFPCQTFSNRGNQQGFADERGQLYLELARLLHSKQPKAFIFENVVGLVLMEGGLRSARIRGEKDVFKAGEILTHILGAFEKCGYVVSWKVINARSWVPQQRERVYIVGTRADLSCSVDLDDLDSEGGGGGALRDILEPSDSAAVHHATLTRAQWHKVQSSAALDRELALDGQVPTLTASYHRVGNLTSKLLCCERDGTPRDLPRFLTLRECCRAMGFPEQFRIPSAETGGHAAVAHCYRALGNAVCPPVITAIAGRVLAAVKAAEVAASYERSHETAP